MPLAATQHSAEGAKAFAAFFIKTIDWGYATTSSAYMRHYFQQSCIACTSAADALNKARRKKHRFIGDRFTIRRSTGNGSTVDGVSVYFDINSAEIVDEHGKFVDGYPALSNYREDIYPTWRAGAWQVSRMVPRG